MSDVSSSAAAISRPAPAPWRWWLGVVVAVVVFFGTQTIAGILILLYASAQGWSSAHADDWLSSSVTAQFAYMLVAEVLAAGLVYWFARRYTGGLKALGLRQPRWSDLTWGVLAVVPYFVMLAAVTLAASVLIPGLDVNQKQELGFNDVNGQQQLFLTFVALVVLPPIAEEFIFRGLLYSSLKKAFHIGWAVLITSLVFAAGHLPEGGSGGPLYIAAIDTFILSTVLIYLREKTGGLWSSITLHALKNGIAFVSLFVLHLS
jgi:membrane protease YdiL (CAAX protease family)